MRHRAVAVSAIILLLLSVLLVQAPAVRAEGGFPAVEIATGGNTTSNAVNGTVIINMPTSGGIQSGDLLIAVLCAGSEAASGIFATPDAAGGWTKIIGDADVDNILDSIAVYKVANGTEGSSQSLVSSPGGFYAASRKVTYQVYRIVGHHLSTAPQGAFFQVADAADPDPPFLNPATWAIENTLWLATACVSLRNSAPFVPPTISANPGSYSTLRPQDRTDSGFGDSAVNSALRKNRVESENPTAFTSSGAAESQITFTLGIRPIAVPPLITLPATAIGFHDADLNAQLNEFHGTNGVLWFEYGTTTSLGTRTDNSSISGTGTFQQNLAGLAEGITYFFRAHTEEVPSGYTNNGSILNLTTRSNPPLAAAINAVWLLSYAAVLTLMFMGAWWIRRKRQ